MPGKKSSETKEEEKELINKTIKEKEVSRKNNLVLDNFSYIYKGKLNKSDNC